VALPLKQKKEQKEPGPMTTHIAGPPSGPHESQTQPAAPTSASRDDRINILIVDDEQKNLTVLETILDDPGYRLVRAESADQALLALVAEEFALLILDIRMPDMTGFELAQMIKERKKTAQVPIIFLTAYYNEDQHVLEGYGSGAVDYLHKPVNPIILRSKVAVFADFYRKSREVGLANRALLDEVIERCRVEERLRVLNDSLEQRVQERTQALRESDRRKNEFLATLAHELRNPLAPIRNAVQVLHMKGPAIPELNWAKDVIERQVRSMSRLIDDLLDVSRISRGKIELRRDRIKLSQAIHDAVESSRPLIDQQGHQLTVTLPPQPIVLNGDLTRLAQVFLNLLNNAAKFTGRGGRIDLTAERQGNYVVVSVKDTGMGIPAANLTSIFEMFSQVENALSRSHGGLGIGLCLVKRLVELHEGQVEARSDGQDKGSEFLVRLPIAAESSSVYQSSDDKNELAIPTSQLRILVVDDNRDAAFSLTELLNEMGNTTCVAHDGEEAVEAAGRFRPDVMLLDIGLPKMNGYDVAHAIRQRPWGKSIILIAVTGWGQEEDKRKSKEAGFDRHMVKPMEPRILMELIAEIQNMRA
jgi:signal transduction histidine kinase